MELKEAFQKALDFEEKGKEIYTEVAKTTFSPLVKKSFEFLAKEEEKHIVEIKGYIENENENPNIELSGAKKDDVKDFFNMTVEEYKEGIEFSEDDVKAYERAMELETDSYNFYKAQFAIAQDENLKKFFGFLMEQESAHYLMLEKTLKFIRDPQHFYADEEDWNFEG